MNITQEIKEFTESSSFLKKGDNLFNDPILQKIGLKKCLNAVQEMKPDDGYLYFTKKELSDFKEKYNLLESELYRFTGALPKFSIESLKAYFEKFSGPLVQVTDYSGDNVIFSHIGLTKKEITFKRRRIFQETGYYESSIKGSITIDGHKHDGYVRFFDKDENFQKMKSNLVIVADSSLFELNTNDVVVNNTIENIDPAIFERLSNNIYRLITCWGKEQATEEMQKSKEN